MRAFVTGATGFIGSYLAAKLRARNDEVVALVRSPEKAARLQELGCELVEGDLGDLDAINKGLQGCEAAFHAAAVYKVGIPARERAAMFDANVGGTERVLDAAIDQGVRRIVYVSTVNVFGNTRGAIVDESYHRSPGDYLSTYDESKYLAHQAAMRRIEQGAPIIIVQPGGVYGPGDQSEMANLIDQVRTGRLKFKMFPSSGLNMAHVEDIAEGILLVHDKGKVGESYVLGGEITTFGRLIDLIAEASGRRPPRFTMPGLMIKMSTPLAPLVTKVMRLPPNLRELIRAGAGVTYWATDQKARRELGYKSRDLATGMRETLATG